MENKLSDRLNEESLKEIKKTIFRICPTCKEESEFEYIGEQETNRETFHLYTCQNPDCYSTLTSRNIEEYNDQPTHSSQ